MEKSNITLFEVMQNHIKERNRKLWTFKKIFSNSELENKYRKLLSCLCLYILYVVKELPYSYLRGGLTLWQWDGCEFRETGCDEGILYSSSSSSPASLALSEWEFANGPVHLPEWEKKVQFCIIIIKKKVQFC